MNKINFARELEVYSQIYALKKVTMRKEVDEDFFNRIYEDTKWLAIVLYDRNGNIYLEKTEDFNLTATSVADTETMRNAINRVVNSLDFKASIELVEPICLLNIKFIFENNQIDNNGLAVMAQIKETNKNFVTLTQNIYYRFQDNSERKILSIFLKRYHEISKTVPEDYQEKETETNKKYQNRYRFHNLVVKRILLNPVVKKRKEFLNLLKTDFEAAQKILDVSCGDNSILFSFLQDISNRNGFIVANDISYSQVELIKQEEIVFTQHNAISLPFKENAFDIVYCGNTLHHMPNKEALQNLLQSMFAVGKKVIIVEIDNPDRYIGTPKLLNKYYRNFLKDVGENYLSAKEFANIIKGAYEEKGKIEFTYFQNIQGTYLIAKISKIK